MNIIPGEPIPPGFEDEVNRVAEIQSTIDNYRENALIGIEYTVELVNNDDREPTYMCLLCEKRGDPRTIIAHWISYNHRLKFLEKHFPSAVRELAPVRYKPDSRQAMSHLITGLCDAIENHYGRLTVTVCHNDDFRSIRDRILDEVNNKYHFDEKNGPSFLNAIDRELLDKNAQILQITIKSNSRMNSNSNQGPGDRDSLDSISSEDENQRKPPGPSSAKKKRRSQSPAYKVLPRVRRSPPFEEARQLEQKKGNNVNALPTPKELSMQAFQIAQERYKWEKYRCMLEIAIKGLDKSLKEYEKNPEKHPLYPEEWKKFWNRRYKELQQEKQVDPNKYDYKPEWIVFWTKRMKELHAEEVEEKKKQIKNNLGLKEDAEEKTDMLKQKYKIQAAQANNPRLTKPSDATSNMSTGGKRDSKAPLAVIDISDDDDDDGKTKSKRTKRSGRSMSRSLSPLSDDYRDDRRHSYRPLYERSRIPRSAHYPPPRGPVDYYSNYHSAHFPPPPTYGPGYRVMDPYMYPQYEKQVNFPPSKGKSSKLEEKEEPEDDGPLTVVAVLRLLTALEEHLGSLGPKVVDLLGKALALEKVKANSADDMLVNEDNSVFFETIKEKLKGLLIADVLDDPQKVRAVKKAIKNIAAIIHQVNERGKSSTSHQDRDGEDDKPAEDKTIGKKTSKPTIADLPFDRQIVSTKLAAALVMQGREDVTTGDMDKLIYVFILLVKLSKEQSEIDGKPMQMKQVLEELGIVPKISPSIVEEIIEQEVSALVADADLDLDLSEKDANAASSASALESLTDSDLQTLLQNFKHLSTEEQHHLIAHLKKLETADPVRVEKLRKYVNLETDAKDSSNPGPVASDYKFSDSSKSKRSTGHDDSPRSVRKDNYTDDEASRSSNVRKFIDDDDEDDDYNFEDVFKAASSNVNLRAEERPHRSAANRNQDADEADSVNHQQRSNLRQIPIQRSQLSPDKGKQVTPPAKPTDQSSLDFKKSLTSVSIADTQNLIANLMGSLQQSCGQFNTPKSSQSSGSMDSNRSRNPPNNGNGPQAVDNSKQSSLPSSSLPYYQQQQQQQPQQQQQQQQQQMYSNFQNMQNMQNMPNMGNMQNMSNMSNMPNMPNYYPGNYNNNNSNVVSYPNFGYPGQPQPGMNNQFGMSNYMQGQPQGQGSNPPNYNMYGGGYK